MKRIYLIFSIVILALFASCATTEMEDIPTDLSAAQLLQLGQDAEGASQYKNAENYFNTTIQRFGLDNSIYIEARYELGCCYFKEKQYDKAEVCFNEILSIYEDSDVNSLPPEFQKLATLKLNQINKKR